jgi:nucleoside-diphosphate-sugar epimerase
MTSMEVVVTGASGFVGRGLLETLAAAGHVGVATGRTPPRELPAGWRGESRADLLAAPPSRRGPDAIVHLEVRQGRDDDTAAGLADLERVNVGGTQEWLEWGTKGGVPRFVFVSSVLASAPSRGERDEDAALATGPGYGGTKARAEGYVRSWAAASGTRCAVILRPAPVYGPAPQSNLLPLVRRVLAGRPCVVGSGRVQRSVVSRRNLAAAIEFALRLPGAGTTLFNVSDPRALSAAELATLIAEVAGAPPPRHLPEWGARGAAAMGDLITRATGLKIPFSSARLRANLESSEYPCRRLSAAGFVHPHSTRQGLAELVEWVRREGQA